MSERESLLRAQPARDHHEDGYDGLNNTPENINNISRIRGVTITTSVFLLLFLSTSNISVLSTIQSHIAIELHATTKMAWFVSVFLVATASTTPLAGRLCQILTERSYLVFSVLVQAIGLLVSGIAPNLVMFLIGRAIYGVGVAALTPVALILIKEKVPERLQGLFFGLVNCAYTAGISCGAIIGGVLEPAVGWRAVFWLQSPIVVALAGAVYAALPRESSVSHRHGSDESLLKLLARMDYLGLFTLVAAVILLLYSVSAPRYEFLSVVSVICCLGLFVLVELKRAKQPIIPGSVLKSRGAIFTSIATIGVMSARWGIMFYMPPYAIAVRLWSQEQAGVLLIPTNVGFGLGGVVAGWLHIRRNKSYYIPTLVCFLLFALSMLSMASLSTQHSPLYLVILALVANGFIIGALLTYSLAHLLYLTLPTDRIVVIPFIAMVRTLAGAFGSSICDRVLLSSLRATLTSSFEDAEIPDEEDLVEQLLASPLLVQKLQGIRQQIAVASYSHSFRILFLVGAGLTVAMIAFQAVTGWTAPFEDDATRRVSTDDENEEEL